MKKWIVLIAVMALFASAAQGQGDLQSLKAQVKAQEKSIAQMKQQITAMEQKGGSGSTSGEGWWNRINWSGDFRFRTEAIDDDDTDTNSSGATSAASGTRYRNRARARLKMTAKINDEMDVIVRLASGSSNSPTSTNQTLDGQLSKKDVWLDMMYLTYTPAQLEGFQAMAGKMAQPFFKAGGNQLIWDTDVTFEGAALKQIFDISEETQIGVTAGGFWLDEYWGGSNTDQYLLAVQGYVKQALDDTSSVTAGVSYYDFVHILNQDNWATGNSTVGSSPDRMVNDYNLLEIFAQLDTMIQEMPLAVYGTFVKNEGIKSGYTQDTAWAAGVKLNKLKDPGTWQAGYEYRDMENDAVVGFFTDADPVGGGTTGVTSGIGYTTHKLSYKYQAMKNVVLGAAYYMSEQKASGADYDYDKFQFDVAVKFK